MIGQGHQQGQASQVAEHQTGNGEGQGLLCYVEIIRDRPETGLDRIIVGNGSAGHGRQKDDPAGRR